ncbi:MAG TPA: PAS domain S-box protein [Aggregatilineales bacterium]|nr:PAS domain S-box protein [Aggregatilineales bacterium]
MSQQASILIIDHDLERSRANTHLLRTAGYAVAEASAGEQGFRQACKLNPDLILLDESLPDASAIDVCTQFKAEPSLAGTMVIMTSAIENAIDGQADGLEVGADAYLMYPLPDRELLAQIQTFMRIKQAEEAVRASEAQLRAVIDASADGIIIVDRSGRIQFANHAAAVMFQRPTPELIGAHLGYPIMGPNLEEIDIIRPQGMPGLAEIRAVDVLWHGESAFLASLRDITERRQNEEILRRTDRAMKMLTQCNQVMVRTDDEDTLLKNICDIAVDFGGYRMAWVGMLDPNDSQTVRPVAWAGVEEGYLQSITVHATDDALGHGPTGSAIRTGRVSVIKDVHTDPRFSPWRAEAQKRGYASVIGLPLLIAGTPIGVLGVYSADIPAFEEEEVKLLEELASDLAYGLGALRTRAERARMELALKENQEKLRAFFDSNIIGIVFADIYGTIKEANGAYLDLIGYSRDALVSGAVHWIDITPPEYLHLDRQHIQEARDKGICTPYEKEIARRDGSRVWVLTGFTLVGEAHEEVVSFVLDLTEQKRAEEQLRKLERAVEQSANAVMITDIRGDIEYVNPRFTALTGYTVEEVLGKNPRFLQSGETPRQVYRQLWDTINAGGEWSGEIRNRKKSGELYWEYASISAVLDPDGHITHFVAIKEDISDRRTAEEALREYARRLEFLHALDREILAAQSAPDITRAVILRVQDLYPDTRASVTLVDPANHRYRFITEGGNAQRIGDWRSVSDMLGVTGLQQGAIVVVEDMSMLTSPGLDSPFTGDGGGALIRIPLMAQGLLIGTLDLVSDHPGAFPPAQIASLQEVADQLTIAVQQANLHEQVEQYASELERRVAKRTTELHQAMERVKAVLDSTSDAIIVADTAGQITIANPAFIQQFGVTWEKIQDGSLYTFVDPDSAADLELMLGHVVGTAASGRLELTARRQDGTFFDADVVLSPIAGRDSVPSGLVCSIRDITVRKAVEEELRHAFEREKELSELKSRFFSMASHDFRTPLAVILSSADILKMFTGRVQGDEQGQTMEKYLGKISSSVRHMSDLLDDVLLINKADAGKLEIEIEPIELESFCQEIMQEVQLTAGPNHVLTFSLTGQPTTVLCDRPLLRQILVNLLSNALKYSPDGGHVRLTVVCEDNAMVFQVQDEGIGIPEQDQPRLFETFHRATNVGTIKGTGLGLAITKRAAMALGGTVRFKTQVGRGTTFTVSLPVK